MCVADEDEWSGSASGGYGSGSVDTIEMVVTPLNISFAPDTYAGVDWEEIHPSLMDSLPGGFSGSGLEQVIEEIDLSALEEYGLVQGHFGAQLP